MDSSKYLPDNDIDVLLAHQIDDANQNKNRFEEIENELIQSLMHFKYSELKQIQSLSSESLEMWNSIIQKTQVSNKSNVHSIPKVKRLTNIRIWATAASLLLAAFIGIFWFVNSKPSLIAESGSVIKNITLADGTLVTLRPQTKLYELSYSSSERTYELVGEGFFNVKKDPNRPFTIQTNTGSITVLGTRFNVSTWGNYAQVYLEEGSVELKTEAEHSVILEPGQVAKITNTTITDISFSNGDKFKDWISNLLTLDSTPLYKVIEEIEHHFDIKISISNIKNTSELITGSVALETVNQTLTDIGIILGGSFTKTAPNSYTFIPLN